MSAPSFSSFQPPPSFSSFPDIRHDSDPSERDTKSSRKSSSKKTSDKYGASESKKRRRKEAKEKGKGKDSDRQAHPHFESRFGDDTASLNKVFFSDRKGDPLNVTYGGLHAGDVPRHHLFNRSRILGLPLWNVIYRSRRGVEVDIGRGRKMRSITDGSARALLNAAPSHTLLRLSASRSTSKYEETADGFIKLPSFRNHPDTVQPAHHAIPSTIQESGSSGSSSEESDDESIDGDSPIALTAHQETIRSLEDTLSTCPFSIPSWLELLSRTLSTIPLDSKNATKTRAEITVSILSRALEAHPDNAQSAVLRLRYVRAGEQIWSEEKCRAAWEEALKSAASNQNEGRGHLLSGMWLEWLDWKVRSGGRGIEGFIRDFDRAKRAIHDSLVDGDREFACLRLMWRSAAQLQAAGLHERATAIFQAQAELALHCPRSLRSASLENQLDALEEFWESEAPRFGEPRAQSWSDWVSSGKPDPAQDTSATKPIENKANRSGSDPYTYWASNERDTDARKVLPIHSTDPEADTDPYATVLFSDIRPFLFKLENDEVLKTFRMVFIDFLGLHVPGITSRLSGKDSDDEKWCARHLSSHAYLESLFPRDGEKTRLTADSVAGTLVGRERIYSGGCFGPVKNWSLGVVEPLDIFHEKRDSRRTWLWTAEDVKTVADHNFMREVFRQLRLGNGEADEEWDEYALAFEANISIKSAVKLSRSFLSSCRNSLRRWTAHARLEQLRGKIVDARKVYQTALSTPHSDHTSHAFYDWAEMEWLQGNPDESLKIILKAAGMEGDATSSITLLKARRKLDELNEDATRKHQSERWIDLRALLELLSTKDINLSLGIFDRALQADGDAPKHERLMTLSLLMVYHYAIVLKNPLPPAVLRERVSKAADQYSSNSIIIGLFLEAEKGQGIWGRVRTMLGQSSSDKSVIRRVEDIWIASWDKGGWAMEKERTREGLSSAVSSCDRTRESGVLWRIYVELEIRCGAMQRAKALLYRAIGDCPLSKDLYLLAFGPLRSVFTARELNSFADAMAERGLRMRMGLEELLAGYRDNSEERSDSEYGEEDIEFNAVELRRLKPY